jgi:hypothetical protein
MIDVGSTISHAVDENDDHEHDDDDGVMVFMLVQFCRRGPLTGGGGANSR